MEGGKKVLAVVGLLIVIIGAVVFIIRSATKGRVRAPSRVVNPMLEKIDVETLETVTLPADEWKKLGRKGRLFKNPKTGKYTMTTVMYCPACKKKVPDPTYNAPLMPTKKPPDMTAEEFDKLLDETMAKVQEAINNYTCPHCGYVGPPTRRMPEELEKEAGASTAGGPPAASGK